MIDPITRMMGAAGLAVAIASLLVTAFLWYRSGPRLKVVVAAPAGTTAVQIEVINFGRVAASVRAIELRDHFVHLASPGTEARATKKRPNARNQ